MRIPKSSLSVCPYPEKRNHLSFVNVSPTVAIDTSMERSSRVLHHENSKNDFFFFNNAYFSVTSLIFCKQFLFYIVHIDRFAFLGNH